VRLSLLLLAPVALVWSTHSDYLAVKRKFDQIAQDRMKPGARVSLTPQELNAYVEQEVKRAAPDGVRQPKVELGSGTATGSALIDFAKVRTAQGNPPGWLMSRLLSGERPVTVTARIESKEGKARVDVQRVEISGVPIEGTVLDYLIENYVRDRYPQAKIGQPFELGHNMERVEVRPGGVNIHIAR
jgi:hypothetical protein